MPCSACGAAVSSESVYCPKCGHRLEPDENSAEQPGKSSAGDTADRFREATRSHNSEAAAEEETLWEGGYSAKAMVGSWFGAALASLALIALSVMFPPAAIGLVPAMLLIWVFLGALLAYRKLGVNYELSTQRFIHKVGILKRVTDRIEVIDIDDVTFEQGIVQRMVGVGTIKITSSDRTHPELLLRGIDEVQRIANLVDDVRRKERRSRGLHIETI